MSYLVTIVRTRNGTAQPIPEEEVRAALERLAHWSWDAEAGLGTCTRDGRHLVTVDLHDGALWTKNPDEDALGAMLELAAALDARVRGDELETYRTPTETWLHPDDRARKEAGDRSAEKLKRRSRHRSIVVHAIIIGGFLLAAFLVSRCSGD